VGQGGERRVIVLAAEPHPGFQDEHPIGVGSFLFKPFFTLHIAGHDVVVNRIFSMVVFAALVVGLFFYLGFRKPKLVPGRLQWAAESVYGFIREGVAREVMGPAGLKFAPYLTVLFCFIFVNNLYEILPLAQVPVNSRIAFPLVLALITYGIYNYMGIKRKGLGGYLKSIAIPPGVPKGILVIVTPIEIISQLILQPATLAIRLFANMFAGHLLLLVFFGGALYLFGTGGTGYVFGGVSFIMSIVLTMFELIVIALQAYVFTILTSVYISNAMAEEH
jgi:F-type H+-transporting ATPase subunit a